jgi:hypothetical protein
MGSIRSGKAGESCIHYHKGSMEAVDRYCMPLGRLEVQEKAKAAEVTVPGRSERQGLPPSMEYATEH